MNGDAEWTEVYRGGYRMRMAITVPRYTVADLDAFPSDGNRYELLDGVLLVTPLARHAHQLIANRLQARLTEAIAWPGDGNVVGPGLIRVPPATQLEPDILVYPAHFGPEVKWEHISGHWLAVEVLSPSSRMYDREFKRDAYLALGVNQVWLVDMEARCVEVSWRGSNEVVRDTLRWRVPEVDRIVAVDLREVFAGLA